MGVKISFITIVLNGLPFLEYSLKAIYPFAHEVIVVEGAVRKARFASDSQGLSVDGTTAFLDSFPDPEGKLHIIRGTWPEKEHMQTAALRVATGDYVWLVDSDEVYKYEHIERMRLFLEKHPEVTQVNFIPYNFWKGLDYIFKSPVFERPEAHYRRIFKFEPGAQFISHRPPTLAYLRGGTADSGHVVSGFDTRKMGIEMFHYSYVLPSQVKQKITLYKNYGWDKVWRINLDSWYNECFLKWTPENREEIERVWGIWTGDPHSYTEKFEGTHPEVMDEFIEKYGRNFYGQDCF